MDEKINEETCYLRHEWQEKVINLERTNLGTSMFWGKDGVVQDGSNSVGGIGLEPKQYDI